MATPSFDMSLVPGVVVAALDGLAVGVERQRSGHATGQNARLGGVRTFTLLGAVAGLAGAMSMRGLMAVAVLLIGAAAALIVVSYFAASRRDVDATTEVAGLVVLAAGFLAGLGQLTLASGIIALTTLLLVEKSRLHALVQRIDDRELRAAFQFGVMAIVILPLLPAGPFGPFGGIRPQQLWLFVLFFTGISFIGYLARRLLGPSDGYPATGLIGGIVSSTNVTLTFARMSRGNPVLSAPLAAGVIGACTMLFPRVLIATMVLDSRVAAALLPYLAAPVLLGALMTWRGLHRHDQEVIVEAAAVNPLQLGPALQMAATFQIVLFGVYLIRMAFGDPGLLASGAVLGITDVDALTISMAKSAREGVSPHLAAHAIALGILVNAVLKTGIAVLVGDGRFRRIAGISLGLMALASAVALVFVP